MFYWFMALSVARALGQLSLAFDEGGTRGSVDGFLFMKDILELGSRIVGFHRGDEEHFGPSYE